MAPVAEAHQIAVLQLAALWRTRRTRSVEQDEQRRRCDVGLDGLRGSRQGFDILGQQHLTLIFIYDRTQLLVGNEQLGTRIPHHEVQTLGGIAGIQRLVGTTGFQHT